MNDNLESLSFSHSATLFTFFIFRYGALDAKLASKTSFPYLEFTAVAGPPHDNHPPFKWSTTNITDIPVFKPIDEFNFTPIVWKGMLFPYENISSKLR